jgi:transposase
MSENGSEILTQLVIGHKRDGRSIYSKQGKRALVEMSLGRGASVAKIAQQHGVNANLLRKWIDAYRDGAKPGAPIAAAATSARLLPIVEVGPSARARQGMDSSIDRLGAGHIEIELCGATVRVHGEVIARQLEIVLGCLARRT